MYDYKGIFLEILQSHNDHNKWDNALFQKMKQIANTKVGSVGEDFIKRVCQSLDLQYELPLNKGKSKKATQSPWDIKIEGIEFEIKTATEDTGGNFQFNHIRYHRKYDAVLCLGVSPDALLFDIWSKADISTGKAGNLVSMEKSANASYKLTKRKGSLKEIMLFDNKIRSFIQNFS